VIDGIADYEFVRSLGKGNNGEFFLARTPARLPVDDEYVAVKVLSGLVTDDVFRRATRELSAFAAVPSPYLVTLFDAGQQGEAFYYAMEYLEDGDLESSLASVPTARALRAVASAARAAHALHEAGIVHRDIKPANILLGADTAKLTDLGLSQLLTPGVTITGMGSTTSIEYVDPVLIQGAPASRATDIFSIGATLHRVVAGHGLYGELPTGDPMLALRKVFAGQPKVADSVPPAVAAVITEAIDPDLAQRPVTAEVLAERIEALV
jgi:eukaryotic-like serine/threonine-protein kinase